MKTWLNKLFFIGLAPLVLWSCKKAENKVYFENGAKQTLTLSASSVTMTKATGSSFALKAAWNAAEFGYSSASLYTIQFDKTGGSFAAPYEVSTGTDRAKEFTQLELNTAFLATGNEADKPGSVIMRIKSVVSGTSIAAVYSNVVTLTGTPYSLEPPSLYIPGAYQGWDPTPGAGIQATRIWAYTSTAPKKFDGYVYFSDASKLDFKITTKANWDVNYGQDPAAAAGVLKLGGDNLKVASTGLYRLEVDLTTDPGTIKLTNLGVGWSLIGNAFGASYEWNTDFAMTYDQNTKIWSAVIAMADGKEFKFRANNDWTINFGDGGTATLAGGYTLKYGAGNLKVPGGGGNFKVELILSGNENFSYKITKQ